MQIFIPMFTETSKTYAEGETFSLGSFNFTTRTFQTDKFSTYVLAYADTLKTSNPKTGDNITLWISLALISMVGIIEKKKRVSKH